MAIIIILTLSTLLQLAAAALTVWLMPPTGKRTGWILLSIAFLMMAARRMVALHHFLFQDIGHPEDLTAESMALVLSILLLIGLLRIREMFTELKQAETQASTREAYYKNIFIDNHVITLLIDPDTAAIVDANPAACSFYGYTHEEITHKKITDINTLSTAEVFAEMERARTQKRNFFLFRHRLASGEIRHVEVYSGPVGVNGTQLLYSMIHDVSKYEQTTAALKKLTRRNRLLLDATGEGIYGLDTAHNITFINRTAIQMTGWTEKDLLGQNHHNLVHHSHADGTPYPAEACPVHRTIQTGETHYVNNEVFWCKDGSSFPVAYTSAPITDIDGTIVGAVTTFRDISREQATELARIRLEAAIEQAAEIVFITDPAGVIQYVNPAFERITGYSYAEAVGQNPRILNSGNHPLEFYQEFWNTITEGRVWRGKFINKRKDGSLYNEDATISPVFDAAGKIINFVAVKRDITHELELEEQYRQAQKMEAIGRLTGGVAHDFNNILTAINGFAELALLQLPTEAPTRKMVETILESGQRAAALIKQLLAVSRKQIAHPKILVLNDIIVEMSKMLERIIGEDIRLKVVTTPDLWPIKIDPTQIEQIILNLVVNARDAMPDGGQLLIAAKNTLLDDAFVAAHYGATPGNFVALSVADTGIGMSKDVQERIFEPFFTTKEQSKGTGLGLATVYGIVKQNRGNIWVYSEEGLGTTFKLYFPAVEENLASDVPATTAETPPMETATILMVEDDPVVRELTKRILREHSYTVLSAASGEEAQHIAATYSNPIHLLLTDVVMPGMNGVELAKRLSQQIGSLKVVYMSGYSHEIIATHGVISSDILLLEKPFVAETLLEIIQKALK